MTSAHPHGDLMDTGLVTFLFTDIESSTRLWEQDGGAMSRALAAHDRQAEQAVGAHRGSIVKRTGDGIHAVFTDPIAAIEAAVTMQQGLADALQTHGVDLRLRCGMHVGVAEPRDGDWFGTSVNRAARIMSAAYGGQVLLSHAVMELARDRLPAAVSLLDLGSVRLRGLAEPERVYQVVHPGLRNAFPALRSLDAPNNLPAELTSFIGRERELAEVTALLQGTRLLTLTGPGGIGKTRLALEVAAASLTDFDDGAWCVELAATGDPRLVPQALASSLGLKEEPGRSVADTIAAHLADRRVLLVLDNCEHLLEACAELVARLLRATRQVKVIASSREHLRVAGERVYPVPALSLPPPGRTTAGDGTACAAVTLFVERAAAQQPAFALTPANATAVADICRRLDGIPLAIELAAARVRTLPVDQIAARLNDRFRLLVRGDRTALPRQQTLQALIDWSYDLLSPPERALLRRLSVFAGGWTLEGAEDVTPGVELAGPDVLDVLSRLVEKSLVVVSAETSRYALLETVRQYAQSRLDTADEARSTRARHVDHYLGLARAARAELIGPTQAAALARLDAERENLLAAHAYCDDVDDGDERGLLLVSALRRYWIFRGLLGMGQQFTIEALARPGAQQRTSAREQALFDAGQINSWMGRYAEAQRYLDESLSIARERGDEDMLARILQPLGLACMGRGDLRAARAHFEEGVALSERIGDKRELAAALNALAQLHRVEQSAATAAALYRRVLAIARELGDQQSVAIALLNLAMVSISGGAPEEARDMLVEVAALVEATQSQPLAQSLLEVTAGLAALRDDAPLAARLFGAAEALARQTGLQRDPADAAFLDPLMGRARASAGHAAFAAAQATGEALAYDRALADARGFLRAR